jgi:hypothetical protein
MSGPTLLQAKWALDASGVAYKETPWPMSTSYLGELPLRWRLGRLTGRITAPILLPEKQGTKGLFQTPAGSRSSFIERDISLIRPWIAVPDKALTKACSWCCCRPDDGLCGNRQVGR